MSTENLSRTLSNISVMSFNSEDLEESQYSEAPWDIFNDAVEGLGRVRIARTGDSLPRDTKYKFKKGSSVAASFR